MHPPCNSGTRANQPRVGAWGYVRATYCRPAIQQRGAVLPGLADEVAQDSQRNREGCEVRFLHGVDLLEGAAGARDALGVGLLPLLNALLRWSAGVSEVDDGGAERRDRLVEITAQSLTSEGGPAIPTIEGRDAQQGLIHVVAIGEREIQTNN